MWIFVGHVFLFVSALTAMAIAFSLLRAHSLAERGELERIRPEAQEVLSDQMGFPAAFISGMPGVALAWLLRTQGFEDSVMLTGFSAGALGYVVSRWVTRRAR